MDKVCDFFFSHVVILRARFKNCVLVLDETIKIWWPELPFLIASKCWPIVDVPESPGIYQNLPPKMGGREK